MTEEKDKAAKVSPGPEGGDGKAKTEAPASNCTQTNEEDYGYVFFSKRNEIGTKQERESFFGQMREIVSLAPMMHRRCLKNVVRCAEEDPFVRLLLAALKSRGWWVFRA